MQMFPLCRLRPRRHTSNQASSQLLIGGRDASKSRLHEDVSQIRRFNFSEFKRAESQTGFLKEGLRSAAKPVELAAIPFRRPPSPGAFKMWHRLVRLRQLPAQLAAFRCLPIECLRYRAGTSHFAEKEHFDLELTSVIMNLQKVSDANLARRLGALAVGLDSTEFAGACGNRPSLKEPRRPEPFVDSDARHCSILALSLHW